LESWGVKGRKDTENSGNTGRGYTARRRREKHSKNALGHLRTPNNARSRVGSNCEKAGIKNGGGGGWNKRWELGEGGGGTLVPTR